MATAEAARAEVETAAVEVEGLERAVAETGEAEGEEAAVMAWGPVLAAAWAPWLAAQWASWPEPGSAALRMQCQRGAEHASARSVRLCVQPSGAGAALGSEQCSACADPAFIPYM